jgi:hypothetical protein
MEAVMKEKEVIINHFKKNIMAEDRIGQGPNKDRSSEESTSNENIRGNVDHQKGPADLGGASTLDEKSSGIGRRDKGTGLSTKDGLTGSDLDGQVTE